MNNKDRLKNAFEEIFMAAEVNEEKIDKYFDRSYQQWVDGHELDYKDFIKHIHAQKKRIQRVSVKFETMIAEGDKVATIHHIKARTIEGNDIKGRVLAHFTFRNHKIIRCEELTFFDKANAQDRDLGHVK